MLPASIKPSAELSRCLEAPEHQLRSFNSVHVLVDSGNGNFVPSWNTIKTKYDVRDWGLKSEKIGERETWYGMAAGFRDDGAGQTVSVAVATVDLWPEGWPASPTDRRLSSADANRKRDSKNLRANSQNISIDWVRDCKTSEQNQTAMCIVARKKN